MQRFKVPAHLDDLVNQINWGTPGPPHLPCPKVGGDKGNHRGLHIESGPEAPHSDDLVDRLGSHFPLSPLTSPTDQVIWTTIPYRGGSATRLPLTSSSAPIKPY